MPGFLGNHTVRWNVVVLNGGKGITGSFGSTGQVEIKLLGFTANLLENTGGAAACYLLGMLTCAPLMTSSHSEGHFRTRSSSGGGGGGGRKSSRSIHCTRTRTRTKTSKNRRSLATVARCTGITAASFRTT